MNRDIRLSTGFWSHPKTRKLMKRLGLEGVRSLQILWLWAAQEKPDGCLAGMDWEDIELAADWQGEERALFEHCLGVWIDEENGCYLLHDWAEHNPWQAEAAARREQASKNARSGWEKRRAKQPHDSGNAGCMPQQCDCNAPAKQPHDSGNAPSPYPSPKDINTPPLPPASGGEDSEGDPDRCENGTNQHAQEKPSSPQGANPRARRQPTSYSTAFEAFWQLYPRKVGKDAAWRVWKRKKHELPPVDELAAILARQCHCEQWQRDGGQYIPHPATWLNQGRWQDEIETAGAAMAYPEGW